MQENKGPVYTHTHASPKVEVRDINSWLDYKVTAQIPRWLPKL